MNTFWVHKNWKWQKENATAKYIDERCEEAVTLADAQATIAALQARVRELEEITKVICGHCCEPMEIPSKAVLQSALTQRTAECDALKLVNDTHMKTVFKLSHVVEQRTAELERVKQALCDMAERRCGTCQWLQVSGLDGSCRFPLPEWVTDTLVKVDATVFPMNFAAPSVRHVNEGKDCPTWHPKTT